VLCCAGVLQIIGKGVPEDAMQGIPDKQVPLPDELVNFQYMYNSTGSKVSSPTATCLKNHSTTRRCRRVAA
jgi:hypothetical protein